MAEVPFRPLRQLSEYKGKGASASREQVRLRFEINYFENLEFWCLQYFTEVCYLTETGAHRPG